MLKSIAVRAFAVLCWLAPMVAQASDDNYRATIEEALQEFDAGRWPEAIALFNTAHALRPSARTYNGLALAHFENRQYVECITFGEQALASTVRPLTEDQRAALVGVLTRARKFVASFKVTIQPPQASLSVDGYPTTLGADGQLLLNPGEHELVASAPGYQSMGRAINASVGRTGTLRLALEKARAAETGQAAEPTRAVVTVTTEPPTGSVWIDGTQVPLPPDGRLLIEPGSHSLEARAQGFANAALRLEVAPGGRHEAHLRMQPMAASGNSDDPQLLSQWWLWAGVGVAVAAGVVGVLLATNSGDAEVRDAGGGNAGIVLSIPGS